LTRGALDELLASIVPDMPEAGEGGAAPNLDPGEGRYKEQYGVIIICESEAEQERTYTALTGQGYTCRVVVT
jgi:hypothetical protein